ncbi:ORF6N domain protein [compost metagenome]
MNALNLVVNNDNFFKLTGEVNIAGTTFIGKEFKGQRVMTLDDVMTVTGMEKEVIKKTIQRIKDYMVAGEDFIKVDGNELKKLKEINDINQGTNCPLVIQPRTAHLVFFTRNGLDQITQKVDGGRFLWDALKREYFDVAEQPVFKVPQTFAEALLIAAQTEAERERLEVDNKRLQLDNAVKATVIGVVIEPGDDAIPMDTIASMLAVGRNTLYKKLRGLCIFKAGNKPQSVYLKHFEVKRSSVYKNSTNTYLKAESVEWFIKLATRYDIIDPVEAEIIRNGCVSFIDDKALVA